MLTKLFNVYAIALLLLVVVSFSLSSPPSPRIVNGVLVETGEFPYVVSIQLIDQHICGGVIYNDLFVLTAASCVQNIADVTDLFVNVADLNFLDDAEVDQKAYPVLNIELAPEDDGSPGQDDLAVIRLTEPLVFGPNVNCVRVGEVEPTGSSKGIMIGYGATGSGGLPSNRCRKGDVTLAGSCPANNWPNYLEPYMICAGTADDVQKPCDFDYGSPLVQDGVAVGILSQQNNCQSSPYDSSIYTRLSTYYYWIKRVANTQPNNCFTPTTTTGTPTTQPPTTPSLIPTTPQQETSPTTSIPSTTTTTTTSTTTTTTVATTTSTLSAPTTTIAVPFVCPPGSGLYPYPGSCTLYYVCNNGYYIIEKCPDGEVFDPTVSSCTNDSSSVPGCSLQ